MIKFATATALLLSALVGCGGDDTQTSTPTTTPDTSTQTTTQTTTPATSTSTTTTVSVSSSYVLDDFFSNRDYRTELNSETPVTLTLNGDSISVAGDDVSGVTVSGSVATITAEGTYILQGTLSQGQIVVEMADSTHKAQLVLDNVDITCDTAAPIQVVDADKVFVTMLEGSENKLTANFGEDVTADAAIYSKKDITLNGEGELHINVTGGDGIVGKDELTFTSGTYHITVDGHGLDANDSIAIADGTFYITAEKDGIHCEHASNPDKGYVFIADGHFVMDVEKDGIDASHYIEIWDGYFDITTCGGQSAAPVKVAAANTGGGMMGGMTRPTTTTQGNTTTTPDAMMGQMGQMQDGAMADREQMMQGQDGAMADRNQMMQGQDATTTDRNQMMQGQMGQMQEDVMGQMGGMPEGMMGGMMGGMELTKDTIIEMATQMGLPAELLAELESMSDEEVQLFVMEQMQQFGMSGGMGQMGGMPDMAEGNFVYDDVEQDDSVSTKGLKAGTLIRLFGGTYLLDCYDDAIHCDDTTEIHGGDFEIRTADDAVHANWDTIITGGNINIVYCFEGIEGQRIDISGGVIDIYANDDGINGATAHTDPDNSEIYINISGGKITMDTNSEGDGVDSNGSILITGGDILVSSTTDTRDTSLDSQYDSIITGGSFIATGSNSATVQNFDDGSTQGSILIISSTVETGAVKLVDSSGTVLVDFQPAKEYQSIHISTPDIKQGETYTITYGQQTETFTMDSLQYGDKGSMGGMMGNRR